MSINANRLQQALRERNQWNIQDSAIEHNPQGGTTMNGQNLGRDWREPSPIWFHEVMTRIRQATS